MAPTDIRAEQQIENHCPFGCERADLDDLGYCCHLVGFTNDGKIVETVQVNKRGGKFVSGHKDHLDEVQKGDKLVNPTTVQLDQGIRKLVNKWVSARVYRKAHKNTGE